MKPAEQNLTRREMLSVSGSYLRDIIIKNDFRNVLEKVNDAIESFLAVIVEEAKPDWFSEESVGKRKWFFGPVLLLLG